MSTIGHHLVLRLQDDRVIAPSPEARRAWTRTLCVLAAELPVLVWKLADTHLHVVLLGTLEETMEFVRRLRIRLAATTGVPLEIQRTKPITSQAHLEAAFRYVLRQDPHHGIDVDVLQEAGALHDILGLRRICAAPAHRVREHLPRIGRGALLELLGVEKLDPELHAAHLADAACAAFALDELARGQLATRARRAALAAAHDLGPTRAAGLLGMTREGASRAAKGEVSPADVRAVALQMALRAQLATRPLTQPAASRSQASPPGP